MLYKAGIPIYLILLIYGIRFLITGLITPFFVTVSHKIGIAKFIGENVFYVIFILSIVSTIIINIDIKSEKNKI